ncbi:MAG: deoxyguanosinetriphosphate triphosphohydrolase [Eubacterium sp.]|nr:deoxyguanosinetriphosphate triphosphohydrolase [Eubacterium sp.]
MTIREKFEKEEHERLSEFASKSDETRGRDYEDKECDIRTAYQRDRDKIIHSKSFRRMKHKTQVFLAPYGDHYRTRLTHTLEVAQLARTIAKAIRANEDLTEAIALGHDIGHTPFGHVGERTLTACSGRLFSHNEQSVRVVERIEKDGKGLNLTWEVRDGIRNHKTSLNPSTLEGKIVRIADKIAYVNHDIDDGIRAGVLNEDALPKECTNILGHSTRDRINTIILSVVEHSMDKPVIDMDPDVKTALYNMRQYLFEAMYANPVVKAEEVKAAKILEILYGYYMDRPEEMPNEFKLMLNEGEDKVTVVCDYIAGMTDNFAVEKFQELYIPRSWSIV